MAQLPKGSLVRGHHKPIHGSCAIFLPGGIINIIYIYLLYAHFIHISGSDEAVCFFFSGEGDVPAGRPSSDPGKVEETETWHRFSN